MFCTKDPNQAMLDGDMNDVDIMLTVTGDEFMVGPMNQPLDAWVEEAFGKYLDAVLCADEKAVQEVLSRYSVTRVRDIKEAAARASFNRDVQAAVQKLIGI